MRETSFASRLIRWYRSARRRLPWRDVADPYRIWVSEIMLQQTRVAAAIPYYDRFIERFPSVAALAAATEPEVLAAWSGLGYYSRARNLWRAARRIVKLGTFPADYASFRGLPGIGEYTAAAVMSIAFGEARAAVDGNVLRVLSRHTAEDGDIATGPVKRKLAGVAAARLDAKRPGEFNQALMELGAMVCLPRTPQCALCPVAADCQARLTGRQQELPVKQRRAKLVAVEQTVLIAARGERVLVWQRPAGSARLAGFWELPGPEQLRGAVIGETAGTLRHAITIHNIRVTVRWATVRTVPKDFKWVERCELKRLPLSTIARKALNIALGDPV